MENARRHVTVVAPSRLHFGLYGFGASQPRQFGGVGAMIEHPQLKLIAESSETFQAFGPLAQRVTEFARRWATFHRRDSLPACDVRIIEAPPEHVGLGVGTQLGLSVAAALNAFCEISAVTPAELSLSVGRGQRSAVGSYGFALGGLIAERGKSAGEAISPLDARVEFPPAWRFALITPRAAKGLAGEAEVSAFQTLPDVPEQTSARLIRIVREELLPAALQANFVAFSDALGRYCYEAGLCFAAIQGGPFNGPVLTRFVDAIKAQGVRGVGQSSWGPTLFALLPSDEAAHVLIERLRSSVDVEFSPLVTGANNCGARVKVE